MPPSDGYHQGHSTMPWQTNQPYPGTPGGHWHGFNNPCIGTPVANTDGYDNHRSYTAQFRESQVDAPSNNRMALPYHNMPQGGSFHSQHGYEHGKEYYAAPQMRDMANAGHLENPHPRDLRQEVNLASPHTPAEGRATFPPARDTRAFRGPSSIDRGPHTASPTPTAAVRPAFPSTSGAHRTSGGGSRREPHCSQAEQTHLIQTSNSTAHLRTNTSKSSPPYTLSERKQHRVEERSYLKEVKRSIAEGRVPQVRLQQDNFGDIVQYKAQFLNALKLAALALVPNANIDVKNPSTMQEIMQEVKRQFIIEKPLPEGMVEGYLQRLYKRNRAMYHRHWTVHGDHRKPDDCSSATWLQLIDYWKSSEGSKECERNKANASSKKGDAVRYHAITSLLHCIV